MIRRYHILTRTVKGANLGIVPARQVAAPMQHLHSANPNTTGVSLVQMGVPWSFYGFANADGDTPVLQIPSAARIP